MATDYEQQRLFELTKRVIKATKAGTVTWQGISSDDTAFYYKAGNGTKVWIGSRDRDGRPPFDLIIQNPSGTTVGKLEWEYDAEFDISAEWNQALAELYGLVRAKVLDIDKLLDELEDELPA